MHLAFVLLSQARLPKPEEVVQSFGAFAVEGESVRPASTATTEILELQLTPAGTLAMD
jgi:hypothetical protein